MLNSSEIQQPSSQPLHRGVWTCKPCHRLRNLQISFVDCCPCCSHATYCDSFRNLHGSRLDRHSLSTHSTRSIHLANYMNDMLHESTHGIPSQAPGHPSMLHRRTQCCKALADRILISSSSSMSHLRQTYGSVSWRRNLASVFRQAQTAETCRASARKV